MGRALQAQEGYGSVCTCSSGDGQGLAHVGPLTRDAASAAGSATIRRETEEADGITRERDLGRLLGISGTGAGDDPAPGVDRPVMARQGGIRVNGKG